MQLRNEAEKESSGFNMKYVRLLWKEMELSIRICSSQQQPADVAGRKAGRDDSGEKSRPLLPCMYAWMITPTRNLQFN